MLDAPVQELEWLVNYYQSTGRYDLVDKILKQVRRLSKQVEEMSLEAAELLPLKQQVSQRSQPEHQIFL